MKQISLCSSEDLPAIGEIINESALAYKGVIPADRWHEPYMPSAELQSEIRNGVRFYGYREGDRLIGVMGIQDVKDVTLIRHAYSSSHILVRRSQADVASDRKKEGSRTRGPSERGLRARKLREIHRGLEFTGRVGQRGSSPEWRSPKSRLIVTTP